MNQVSCWNTQGIRRRSTGLVDVAASVLIIAVIGAPVVAEHVASARHHDGKRSRAAAASPPRAVGGDQEQNPVLLTNDVPAGDGKLEVTIGDFGDMVDGPGFLGGGQWVDFFDPGPVDPKNPASNNPDRQFPSFTGLTIVHFPIQGHKVALTEHPSIMQYYNDCDNSTTVCDPDVDGPADMELILTQPNTDPAGGTSTSSEFIMQDIPAPFQSPEFQVQVSLTQTVYTGGADGSPCGAGPIGEVSACLEQTYVFRNLNDEVVDAIILRHIDQDMPWVNPGAGTIAADDIVGMDNIVFGYPQVYAQDGTVTTAALTLRTSQDPFSIPGTTDFAYYVTKGSQGGNGECSQPPEVDDPGPPCYLDPDCATQSFGGGLCPAQTAGTVHAYWNRPGVPNCWKNFVPCFARNISGQTPLVQGDAAIGLQLETSLQPAGSAGDTYEFTLITTYGFRPTPPVFFPPETATALVEFDRQDGCAEFFFSLKNVNPGGSPPMPDPINEFYLNIEAGAPDPASDDCRSDILSNVEPPMGFTASICKPFDANGHGVVKFTGGSIEPDLTGEGRIKIDTNGLTAFTNADTGITVPPLAIVVSIAQNHPEDDFDADAACASGDIGPSADDGGLWSVPISTVAFQAVPSLNTVARGVLTLAVCGLAVGLISRARRHGIA